jgi:fatty acid-binding protein DegV
LESGKDVLLLTLSSGLSGTYQFFTLVAKQLMEKYPAQVFATAKKMGAETAEANMNAGLAAARQIVDFLVNGNRRFQVNK